MSEPSSTNRAEVMLAEFKALRDEIQYRTGAQNTLASIQLLAVSGIAAVIFRTDGSGSLLSLIYTPLGAATGLLWLDHARSIANIGEYIERELWGGLGSDLGVEVLPSYESYKDRVRRSGRSGSSADPAEGRATAQDAGSSGMDTEEEGLRHRAALVLIVPFFVIFLLPGTLGIIGVLLDRPGNWPRLGASVCAVLLVAVVAVWSRTVRDLLHQEPPRTTEGRPGAS